MDTTDIITATEATEATATDVTGAAGTGAAATDATEAAGISAEAIGEKICQIIGDELDTPAAGLTPDQHFRSLPNVDSMRVLQIVLNTEKAFDIEIEDEVTFRVQTIGEFQGVVEGLCRQKTSA
ncbi:acyl carrier protein [Streptomyces sp. NPDC051217]|uniref:acyl carrier protein n=1 Tax=Streptomyces sp. NPDC051217 TaxID=3365644 RepID=UPI00379B5DD1